MKLFVNRLKAEFNKIYGGNKRVGDSLKLEGRRMTDLEVKSAGTLNNKQENTLNVNHAVWSDKGGALKSYNTAGDANVDGNGDAVYLKEHQLSVLDSQYVRGVEPLNLEVDIARRLKVGSNPDSPIIAVESLVTHPSLYRVKDSGLLGGKTEDTLDVRRALDADNADLLNDTPQNELVVEKARIATKMTTTDGKELKEEELRVFSSVNIVDAVGETYNLYGLRDYILEHDLAKDIIPDLATTATHIAKSGSSLGYTFENVMTHLKTDSDAEIYKSQRIITSDSTAPAKTGDEYKTWVIEHSEFTAKVATLNSKTTDRAVKFGESDESYNLVGFKTYIKENITVDNCTTANNANKLQQKTVANIISDTRDKILTNAGSNLTQNEVDNFFGANKVKLAVQGIKSDNAVDSDTLGTYSLAEIKQQLDDSGKVNAARYLMGNPNTSTGQVSYLTITQDIQDAKDDIRGSVSNDWNTLEEAETNTLAIQSSLQSNIDSEAVTRQTSDNTLQTNIDTEKGRIDTILSDSTTNFDTFSKAKTYVDNKAGSLGDLDTTTKDNLVEAVNELNSDIQALELSTSSSSSGISGKVTNISDSIGILNGDGTFDSNGVSGNYILGADTVYEMCTKLDTYLKVEESTRISADSTLTSDLSDTNNALTNETNARISADGDLTTLSTSEKGSLVAAINEVADNLSTEETNRTSDVSTLTQSINTNSTAISNEVTARETADTTLQQNITNEISNRTSADNTLQGNIDTVSAGLSTEVTDRTTADNQLQTNITNLTNNMNSSIGVVGDLSTSSTGNLVEAINSVKSDVDSKVSKTGQLTEDFIFDASTAGGTDPETITTTVGTRYYVDVTTKARIMLLPTDSSNFDRILVHGLGGDFETNTLTIATTNGDTIMGQNDSLIVNTNNETFELVYINADWRIL